MSSQNSPARFQGLSYGIGLMLGGVIAIVSSALEPMDQSGLVIACVLGGVAILAGICMLWRWWRGHCESLPISLPEEVHRLPPNQQIEYLQRIMKMSLVAFPVLTVWIAFDLTRLERGNVDSVMLWAPIIMLYQTMGYWPAVFATPALGILCFIAFNRRLKQLAAQEEQDHSTDITSGQSKFR